MSEEQTTAFTDDQSIQAEPDQITKPVPIEVLMNIPAWIMRDPGPLVPVEDDDIDFQ